MSNRRSFIKQSMLTTAGIMAMPSVFSFQGSPNEKIVMGVMGTNSRGFFLATMLAKLPNVEIAYICDVDSQVVDKTTAAIEKITGKKPKGITDIRKLVELKDVDAIAIAAPDHWHAPAALMGVQAGKNVYVEKPCSHSPAEGEMLVAAATKYNKLIQMGSQRRTFPRVVEAIQDLHAGAIGRVYFAKGWYTNARKPIGKGKIVPVPSNLDFELWQGPAPRKQYQDNLIHYNWHWFWNWGTGEALNNGTHEIDVMRWGLGVDFPTKVVSAGGRFAYQDDWQTPDTQTITAEFNNNTALTWEGRSCNDFPIDGAGRGVIFYGEKGTVVIPGGDDYKIYDQANKVVKDVKTAIQQADTTNTMGMGEKLDSLHLTNFLDSIRGKQKLNMPISEGHKSTLIPQLGNISYRVGRALHCDPTNGHIKDDKEATALWSRSYEKGWEMKL